MNIFIIIAGIEAAMTTFGHFPVDKRLFLAPMLGASFDQVPKKVMHCVFHYVSVFLILSTVFLFGIGTGLIRSGDAHLLVRFISLNYAAFAV